MLSPTQFPLTEKQLIAADIDQDGKIDSKDMSMLNNIIGNIIPGGSAPTKKIYYSLTKESVGIAPPQEAIYQIDHALNNVYYLDRIEKCRANQTFVIDTDINTLHGNYRYLEKYAHSELTVFIDPRTMQPYEPNTDNFVRKNGSIKEGNLRVIKQHEINGLVQKQLIIQVSVIRLL